MREKYETLALKDLKAIAKIRGIKGYSTMSKENLIDAMVALDAEETKKEESKAPEVVVENENAEEKPENEKKKPVRKKIVITGPLKEEKGEKRTGGRTKKNEKTEPAKTTEATESTGTMEAADQVKPDETKRENAVISEKKDIIPAENQKRDYNAETPKKPESSSETISEKKPETVENKAPEKKNEAPQEQKKDEETLDSGVTANGILEVMPEGFGFIRCDNFMPGADDVYVAPAMIRRFGLKTGDIINGNTRVKTQNEKFAALLYLKSVNGYHPEVIPKRVNFEDMTPIFPDNRIRLETPGCTVAMRVMDLLSPVGKGQRGMIVSPPKAGKTTLLKEVAKSVKKNNPDIHMIILLIDERPEEVTDIKEAIEGPNVEVIYSTFDELPEHHKRVSEMVIERAKRLVEHHKDVMILLDSITRLTRAYNLTVPPSGRTLSGGLDPAALHMPKRFFGAARNMREGGSLTILATALVETGSKMDDVVYEEFKGTGNMEMVLDRKLSEKRIFPAIDIAKSGTRRDDLLLSQEEIGAVNTLRRGINGLKPDESVDRILDMFSKTRTNEDFIRTVNKIHLF